MARLTMNEFPPRLAHQTLFYPVINAEYARTIAAEWNVNDEASAFAGYVTEFEVNLAGWLRAIVAVRYAYGVLFR